MEETDLAIIIKHGGAEHKIENLLLDHTLSYLKSQIEELTNVRACRQKLFGLKTKTGKPLTDDMTLEETLISDNMKIMMMGSQEDDIKSIEKASKLKLPPLDDDFDLDDDDPISDARIPKEPAYHAKIYRRVKHYKIKMLNEPRPNKKLLVLDIDYTLFDHRSTAQTAAELMRPYLHEFLTAAYEHYDIVIWSATSMRYIEAKMNELRVSTNPNYKIMFYLDSGAMISVESQKYGLLNVKPLAVIWGKFPGQYTFRNTIMFDDTRRNFLMNPQNGLKIKAFREAWKNRETDQELFYLSIYLNKIAELDDFTSLNHKNWQRLIDRVSKTMSSKDFQSGVAQHYNQVEQKSIKERKKSDIIELRSFNNAMKSLMHYTGFKFVTSISDREMLRVLDLGCGKGGDLPKYIRTGQVGLIVGVDIADVSIEQCKERYRSFTQPRRPKGEFFVADLTRVDITELLLKHNCTEKFHLASSQFSIHYSFESFEQAVRYISNAANNLMRCGVFIGTYPDGPKLLKLARLSKTPGLYEVDDILSVQFSPEDLKNPKPFGTKYHFKLKEVVDCPEFLVHPEILRSLMKALGFIEVFDRSFEEQLNYCQQSAADKDRFREIFERHKALNFDHGRGKATFDEKMWSVASIYRCFCYRKVVD